MKILLVLLFVLFVAIGKLIESANSVGWFRAMHPWVNKAAKTMETYLQAEFPYLTQAEISTLVFYYCQYLERVSAWKTDDSVKQKVYSPKNYLPMLASIAAEQRGQNNFARFAEDAQ